MDWTMIITIAVLILLILGVALYGWNKYLKKTKKAGDGGEKKVARKLHAFAKKNGGVVLNNVYLPLYDQTTEIDHILIAPFGVLVVETKNHHGEIYANPSDREWTQVIGNERHKFYNPLMQNKTHTDNVRYLFDKERIYKIRIESLVVFSGKKVSLIIPKDQPVIPIKKLSSYLRQPRFREDRGVQVQKVAEAIKKHRVTDKKRIKAHDETVREIAKNKDSSR